MALTAPRIRVTRGEDGVAYQELFVIAAGVGHRTAFDQDYERLSLTDAELGELGRGLYEVLRRCRGYVAVHLGGRGWAWLAESRSCGVSS